MTHPPTTFVHDLANRLRCRIRFQVGRRQAIRHPESLPSISSTLPILD
jgi:hypothetical protein